MSEKIRLKGQLKLPVVGRNPIFAQMKFVKVALSEPDILPDSGSIFTCDEQGNYDFEIYTGAHLLSYNVGNAWSKSIEIIAEPLAEGLESIEISDLIGFQEIPELDATIAALNQQKQELLAIQQDITDKQTAVATAAANIDSTVAEVEAGYPSLLAIEYPKLISKTFYVNAATGNDSNDGLTAGTAVKTIASLQSRVTVGGRHTISLDYGKYDIESVNFPNCLVILVGKSNVSSLISAGTAVTTSNASIISIKKSLAMSNRINGAEIQLRNVHITNDLVEGGYTANPLEASYNSCIICDELSVYSSGYESRDHNVALYSKSGGNALVEFLCDGFGITGNVNYLIKGNTTVKTSIAMSTYGIVNRATNDAGSATSLVYSAGFLQVIGG